MRKFTSTVTTAVQQTTAGFPRKMNMPFMFGKGRSESRTVYLTGDITEDSIAEVQQQILDLAAESKEPIYLVVSTYGGVVDEMFSLYDVMNFVRSPIYTIGLGKIMSCGSLILANGKKGHRMLGKSARIMIHSLSGGSYGNYFQILNDAEEMKRQQEMYTSIMSDLTKMSKQQLTDILETKVDKYITGEEAVKLGIVDKLI
jgi:ATP-dependent Clp protease protease subunit